MSIFCLDPRRVAIAGKVRAFALDKTGTLTQAWLDFLAVQPAQAFSSTDKRHYGECTAADRSGLSRVGFRIRFQGAEPKHDLTQMVISLVSRSCCLLLSIRTEVSGLNAEVPPQMAAQRFSMQSP